MKNKLNILLKYLFLFYFGATTYVSMEVCFRGYSHWSMLFLGGICFICLDLENQILPWETPLWIQMLIGGWGIITPLEFITGYIVNIKLGLDVWNYTNPTNFMGQISLPSSIGWCFLSLIGIFMGDILRWKFFGEEKPRYKLF